MSIARRCDICGGFYSLESSVCNNGMLLPDRDGMGHYILCKVIPNGEGQTLMQYDICDECSEMIRIGIQHRRFEKGTALDPMRTEEESDEHI